MGKTDIEKTDYSSVSHGTRGIFSNIENDANIFSAKCLILLAIVAFVLVFIASIVDESEYMHEVRIAIGALVIICVGVGGYCLLKKGGTRYRKFLLCFTWLVALILAVTFVDSSVTLLYAIPVFLAVRYNSVIFTLFVSVSNIVFAFFPYLINTYRGTFPLDFIVLEPGTVITIADNSLDSTVNALENGFLRNETIINMLSYGYLSITLFLVIISVIAVSFTAYNRKIILDQYKRGRNSLEDKTL